MLKAVAPMGAYIFDGIISSYIHIGSISLCCCPVWTILKYYYWQGLDLILPVWKQRFCSPVEVIQDDCLKEICSPGSYGINPGRMQLDRPIHCWSFGWVPWSTTSPNLNCPRFQKVKKDKKLIIKKQKCQNRLKFQNLEKHSKNRGATRHRRS